MKLTVAHTPDADDAYMFYGMVEGGVDPRGLEIVHELLDIQSLNRKAHEGAYEVTAVSMFAYGELHHLYRPLGPGVSFGHGYGPRIIAASSTPSKQGTLAIPGARTTAALLAREYGWEGPFLELPYLETPQAVIDGRAVAALIIHEEQLLFEKRGLRLVVDLGAWWAEINDGLPLPLGVNVVRRDVDPAVALTYTRVFHESIACALAQRERALDYAMQFAREADRAVAREFVGMYVNQSTLDISPAGLESARRLLDRMPAGRTIPADFLSP